jgi:hypothetical protein
MRLDDESLPSPAGGRRVRQDVPVTEQHGDTTSPTQHGAPASAQALVPVVRPGRPQLPPAVQGPLDAALGAAVTVARPVVGITVVLSRAVEPLARDVVGLVARPPLGPTAWTPAEIAHRLAERGRGVRLAGVEDAEVAGGEALDLVIPTVLDRVLDRVDITELVLQRVALDRIVDAVLDKMDLTQVVLDRVDLGTVINAALDDIDMTEIVRTKVDVAELAEEVMDDINLPEIIRQSTTGVAGDVVDGTRLRAVQGDEFVNRLVDRVLLRRKARSRSAPAAALEDDSARIVLGAQQGSGHVGNDDAPAVDGAAEPSARPDETDLTTGIPARDASVAEEEVRDA